MWIALGSFSGLTLGLTDVASKFASRHLGAISVLLVSNIIGCVCIVAWTVGVRVSTNGAFFPSTMADVAPQALMLWDVFVTSVPKNILMIGSLYAMYLSLPGIPMSYAGAIRASGPIWTLLGAWILTGEVLTTLELICIIASIIVYVIYGRLGRAEGMTRSSLMPILGMVVATLSSSLVTAYDKYLAVRFGIGAFDAIQISSAFQRVGFAAILFMLVGGRLSISKAIVFNGAAWAFAEYCYFYSYSSADAKATILAVLRRLSLVSGLAGGAIVFGEKRILIKASLCAALIAISAVMITWPDIEPMEFISRFFAPTGDRASSV